jgi:predicted glycogen debranching enzyme
LYYREEAARGESSIDDCYQPGFFQITVPPRQEENFAIVAAANEDSQQSEEDLGEIGVTMNDVERVFMRELEQRRRLLADFYGSHAVVPASDWLSWILLAADSFVVRSLSSSKSVVAGYHWFETWGRDTFISLPGLMLVTGRFEEARSLLLNFGSYCNDGLIPNFLQDFSGEASCNTVDATLWYVNAVLQYLRYTGDFGFVNAHLWETLKCIIQYHVKGTSFGIHLDTDGLLSHGPRLTWMDAEVDGEAVTPRAGKAVEIQALWYNALRTTQLLAERFGEKKLAATCAGMAGEAATSFNEKFWNAERNCLFDAVAAAGSDASLRSNQIIAVSLDFTMLSGDRKEKTVDVVQQKLVTPCGLRTLEQKDSRYKGVYLSSRRTRDQAYHNGTVWPWLIGPFTTAFLKAKGCTDLNRNFALENFIQPLFSQQISQAGLGTISEIFDGDEPHFPRGCIAQAWSVAEPLRAYVEDVALARPKFEKEVLRV